MGDAAYVCPLFTNIDRYAFNIYKSGWKSRYYRNTFPCNGRIYIINAAGKQNLYNPLIPCLDGHVSIRPHCRINNLPHRYSFDKFGNDVCFHSSEFVPDENSGDLHSFIFSNYNIFLEGHNITEYNSYDILKKLCSIENEEEGFLTDEQTFTPNKEDLISSWLSWGDRLHSRYGITQFAFVNWK